MKNVFAGDRRWPERPGITLFLMKLNLPVLQKNRVNFHALQFHCDLDTDFSLHGSRPGSFLYGSKVLAGPRLSSPGLEVASIGTVGRQDR